MGSSRSASSTFILLPSQKNFSCDSDGVPISSCKGTGSLCLQRYVLPHSCTWPSNELLPPKRLLSPIRLVGMMIRYEMRFEKGMSTEEFQFSGSGSSLNGPSSSMNCLSCRSAYKNLHSLNAWARFKIRRFSSLISASSHPLLQNQLLFETRHHASGPSKPEAPDHGEATEDIRG